MNKTTFRKPGKDSSSPGFVIPKEFWMHIMYICTFKYTPEDVACKLCTEYKKRNCTAPSGCLCIAERIEAGAVSYGEIVHAAFKKPSVTLRWRLRYLIEHFEDTLWESENHEKRFYRMWAELGTRKERDTPQFFAALYLLTANEDISHRTYNAFSSGGIEPNYIRMSGISIPNYALIQAAKSILLNTDHFTLADLSDCDAVNTGTFRLVVNAILVAKYGRDVLKIRR